MKLIRPVNILLIEDNPGDVRLTQEAFKEAGIEVNLLVAMDGLEAINKLKKLFEVQMVNLCSAVN